MMKDSQYMSAKEKTTTLKAWQRFVKACATGTREQRWNAFTKGLYHHLMQHCAFIAHYDRGGFFATYFVEPERTAHFFTQFDKRKGCKSVEYGCWHPWYTEDYEDINRAMCDVATPMVDAIYKRCRLAQETTDVARAKALLAKHGKALEV